jgi:hypothetical protein
MTPFRLGTRGSPLVPAQGTVGIKVRADDARAIAFVGAIAHSDTHRCVLAEGTGPELGADLLARAAPAIRRLFAA